VAPTVNGTTFSPPSTKYSGAGTDQGTALASLNSQLPCDFSFAAGAIDLATDITHVPAHGSATGHYTPGIYCITGAASIGTAGITLDGSGTYIFRMTGALTTVANSPVSLAGASACDVFWTPGAATTLGANSTFVGTDIDASGITIGSTITWTGRALAFGGTVSTTTDTITASTCTAPATATPNANATATANAVAATVTAGVPAPGSPNNGYRAPDYHHELTPGPAATAALATATVGPAATATSASAATATSASAATATRAAAIAGASIGGTATALAAPRQVPAQVPRSLPKTGGGASAGLLYAAAGVALLALLAGGLLSWRWRASHK